MSYKKHLAALLITTALATTPLLAGMASAHDGTAACAPTTAEWHHASFTEAQMKLVHDTLQHMHEANRRDYEDMQKLHEALQDVVSAETFDKKAYMSLTDQIEAKRMQIEKSHVRAFAAIAEQFTPEERKHLSPMFMHHHHGQMHHGEGHEGWHHHHEGQGEHQGENSPADNDAAPADSEPGSK